MIFGLLLDRKQVFFGVASLFTLSGSGYDQRPGEVQITVTDFTENTTSSRGQVPSCINCVLIIAEKME